MTFKIPVWFFMPSLFVLTLIYLGLGNMGHWNYTQIDFIRGNALICLGVGITYLGEYSYKRFKK